jgi:hypothetical protein
VIGLFTLAAFFLSAALALAAPQLIPLTHKLVLVACARKLLIFVNTVVARGTPWTSAT